MQYTNNIEKEKYNDLYQKLNNSQNIIKRLHNENIKLRRSISPILRNNDIDNHKNESNSNLIKKINILTKEKIFLKNQLESVKMSNITPNSDFNVNLPFTKDFDLNNVMSLENEIEKLKTKVNSLEKKIELLDKRCKIF